MELALKERNVLRCFSRLTRCLLCVTVVLLAVQAMAAKSVAQTIDGLPAAGNQRTVAGFLGTSPLRIWLQGPGFGQEDGQVGIGLRGAAPIDDGAFFIDGQYRINSSEAASFDVGLGLRRIVDRGQGRSSRLYGVSAWYDGEVTRNDNYFNQFGLSLECLGECVDFRVNANFPLDDDQFGALRVTDSVVFAGNTMSVLTLTPVERALRVVDAEIAVRNFQTNSWTYGGAYQMDGTNVSEVGYKAGVRGYLVNDLLLDFGASDDSQFGTTFNAAVILFPGRTSSQASSWQHDIVDRLREPVYRNNYIAATQSVASGTEVITDVNGNSVGIVHVSSNATAPGDGTFENPLTSLDDVFAASQQGNIVYVHAESMHSGESLRLRDEQRLLGEGGGETHTVAGFLPNNVQLGPIGIVLPESSMGARMGNIPVFGNAPGDAIELVAGTNDVEDFSPFEISNVAIDGGVRGIAATNGVGAVNVNRVSVANTIGNGIELDPLVEVRADGNTQVRFNPTIAQVSFDNVGGNDLELDTTTGEPAGTPVVEAIAISEVTSSNANGAGIHLVNNQSAASISQYSYDGGATGQAGILVTGAQGDITISQTDIQNGSGGGLAFVSSNGNHTVNSTTITNTGGANMTVDGGDADVTFTGRISQTNNVRALIVEDGHTGTLSFNESTVGTGVLEATDGQGLQFNNADGIYSFPDRVVLTNGTAGIDVSNGSDGVVTFADIEITDPTGSAVSFDGGSAGMFLTGQITQSNNAPAVSVTGGHAGPLVFEQSAANDSFVRVTDGTGLQFDNADGAYTFNQEVDLDGGDAGIDILNNSDGTFAFADTTINNPTGVALNVEGGSINSVITYTGSISQTNNAAAVAVSGGHEGTLIMTEAAIGAGIINATNGTGLQFDNADGDYSFNHAVVLDGGDAGIDILNGSAGTFTFINTTITNPSGTALHVDSSSPTATFNGTITNNAGRAVVLENNTIGVITVNGNVTDTAEGVSVENNSDGTIRFTAQVDLNTGANTAVTVTGNTNNVVSFSDLQAATTSGTGFLAINSDTVEVVGNSNTITSTTGVAVNWNNVEIGNPGATFASISADGAANGIFLNNVTGGAFTVGSGGTNAGDGGVIQNTTGAGIILMNVTNASLNNLSVDTTGSDGISLNHTGANDFNVTISGSTIRNTSALGVDLNASGTGGLSLTMDNNGVDNTGDQSVSVNINDDTTVANLTFNTNNFVNTDDEALILAGFGGTAKTINLLADGNLFANVDPTAVAADFQANGAINLNATLENNTFTNGDAATGRPMEMSANNAAANVRLKIEGNTATAGNGGDDYFLIQNNGTYTVENFSLPVDSLNTGQFNNTGVIGDDPGNIPLPP